MHHSHSSVLLIPVFHTQRGQALTEFLVVAFALIPLFLLVPVIAKYQDISHATQMASRYAAFDATIHNDSQNTWKSESTLADEIRRRFFSNADAWIKTNDVAGEFKAHRNLFWSDLQGNPLIRNFSDVSVAFGNGNGAKHTDAFSKASDGGPFAGEGAMGLRARGIYTANVVVNLANLPSGIRSIEPFNNIDLSIRRHTSLVIDPWTSRSPEQTEERFGKLAPLNEALSKIQPLIGLAINFVELPGEVSPPRFGELEQWRDVVPQDRLFPAKD